MRTKFPNMLGTCWLYIALVSTSIRASSPGEIRNLLHLPLYFEKNAGQYPAEVGFASRGPSYTVFLKPSEMELRLKGDLLEDWNCLGGYSIHQPDHLPAVPGIGMQLRLVNANPEARITGLEELTGKVNYFRGNDPTQWLRNIPTFAKVRCEQVYPGIDLVFYGNDRELEFDCLIAPGADPKTIVFLLDGAANEMIDAEGNLRLNLDEGELLLHAPQVYQLVAGERRSIAGRFVERPLPPTADAVSPDQPHAHGYGFEVAAYDSDQPLVIDPVLSFSTFLGGIGSETASAIAVDTAGEVYLAGRTDSGFAGLNPVSPEPPHTVSGDAFVAKFKSNGSGLIYAVYLGGTSSAEATGIAIDSAGNACIMGDTWSGDFPLVNPIQPNHKYGGTDAFVTKLNSTGDAILYSTFMGGTGSDGGRRIAVDGSDNVYVTGITTSDDFPTTPGAFQSSRSGGWDAFATKINATGSAIVYSTYLGGTSDEFSYSGPTIAVDPSGNAYVVGTTSSTNFPTTTGTFQTSFGGGSSDAFVTKLNPNGSALIYSTYLGGSSYDGSSLSGCVDQRGSVYIAGDSGSSDFPLTPGPFFSSSDYPSLFTRQGGLFISKLSGDGSRLIYSTRLPGGYCFGIGVDTANSAWVAGTTQGQEAGAIFPSIHPIQAAYGGGGSDAFVLQITPDGDQLQFASYIGGADSETASAIASDARGNVYVAGQTYSTSFPTTNAVQAEFGGVADAFVLKISNPDATPPVILAAGNYGDSNFVTIDFSESLDLASATNATNYGLDHGVTVNSVNMGVNSRSVRLLTSGLIFGITYVLTVNGVFDRAPLPNAIVPDAHIAFAASGLYPGFLRQEIYTNVGLAGSLAELTNSANFPDHPDSVTDIHQAEILAGAYYQAGVRLSGWVMPPTTGLYTFYLCNISQAALYLSRNESPINKVRVAFEPCGFGCGGSGPRYWNHVVPGWNGSPMPNVSLPIQLEAGKAYYLEVRAASSATDVLGLAWQPPGESVPINTDLPISGRHLAVQGNPQNAALTITQQPQNVAVVENQPVSFRVKATASSPNLFYQWRRNGADVPGENGPDLLIPAAQLSESGNSYDCVLTIPGATTTSQTALLTVTNDLMPPSLLSAEGNISSGHVMLTFSEPINRGDATNLANYFLTGGLNVSNAVLLSDQRTVVLTTSPQIPGSNYTVQVSGLKDLSTAGNHVTVDTQATFFGWVDEDFVGPFPSWANVKEVYGAVGDGVTDDTAALQKALNEVATPGHAAVLYFPTGTYRITQTLNFFGRISASLAGEDPFSTTIKWDGPADGDLMFADGVTGSRWTRLTWDGSGKARVAIHHGYTGGWQITGNLHTDEIFKDLATGLLVDPVNGGDSHTVIRCHFLRCSTEGIATRSYNAIDWHVWDSVFEDCRYGLFSYVGNFHVYRSLFLRSTEMDVFCGTAYTGIRGNISIGSKSFTDHYINYRVTIQGNTIIDSLDPTPIHWPSGGSMILLDNTIVSRADVTNGPVAKVGDNLTSVGNVFTVPHPIAVGGRAITLEDRVVARDSIGLPPVMIPRFLPKSTSPVFEVPPGANAVRIQEAIDAAAKMNGARPVVHLAAGSYNLDQGLVIPANCDLQLVGDGHIGNATTLNGNGMLTGAAIRLMGPSRATLRDFHLVGMRNGTGVAVENCDQPKARVYMEDVWSFNATINNLVVDRLDQTDVSLHQFTHGEAGQVSLRVIGGARQAAGLSASGRVDLFGGGAGGGNLSYQVEHGGRLLAQDCWFEGTPGFMHLGDSGNFTLNNSQIAAFNGSHTLGGNGAVELDDFHGQVSFLNTQFTETSALVKGDGSSTDLLLLGCDGYPHDSLPKLLTYLDNQSPNARVEQLLSSSSGLQAPNVGAGSPVFVHQMLSQLRTETPRRLVPLPGDVTDVRIYRVGVEACRVGIKLTGTNAPPELVPQPTDYLVTEGSTFTVTNQVTDPDLPFDSFTFTLGQGAPPGISLNSTNGVLTWIPGEAQGPGTNTIQIIIGDEGSPPLFVTNSLTITVLESNLPPTIGVHGILTNSVLEGLVNITYVPPHPARLLPSWNPLGDGNYDVFAGGNQFQVYDDGVFGYQRIKGDFDVAVRLASMEALRPETSAGLMVRETFDDFSRALHILAHPAGVTQDGRVGPGYFFTLQRAVTGGPIDRWDSGYGSGTVSLPHAWMRLRRQSQRFTAYWSDDGSNWNLVGATTATPALGPELYVGLAVTSGYTERNAHFEFRGYTNLISTLVDIPDATVNEHQTLTIPMKASDPDLPVQQLRFSLAPGAPADASIDAVTGQFQWTPSETQGPSTNQVGIIVSDSGVPPLSATNLFTVVVNEVNDPPAAQASSAVIDEDTPVSVVMTGSDPENDPLSFAIVTVPNHGTLAGTVPNLTYLPTTNYHGTDQFTFKVSDGKFESAEAIVSITVRSVNDLPTVSLIRPAANDRFIAPATIELEAEAGDMDGTISKVEFFDAATFLGASTISPFRLSWTNVTAGSHVLSALATDDQAGVSSSAAVAVQVLSSIKSAELLPDGSFRFALAGEPNRQYVIETSEDLTRWTTKQTNMVDASGWLLVTDQLGTTPGGRYYRARLAH